MTTKFTHNGFYMLHYDHSKLENAESIEDILCLATLSAVEKLPHNATLQDSKNYFEKIDHCDLCPFVNKCLACIINE